MDEKSLGDVEIVDATEPQDPKDFDMDAFLAGVRPTRRSVKLYPHAHLIARMDDIADQIRSTPDDVDVDPLIDEFESLKEQFNSGVKFVVEKRSTDWEREFRRKTIADLKSSVKMKDPDSNDLSGPAHERGAIVIHQLAAQIVVPSSVTYEQLVALEDANEGELAKLLRAMNEVNRRVAEAQDVMSADFSRRRSANRAAAGS